VTAATNLSLEGRSKNVSHFLGGGKFGVNPRTRKMSNSGLDIFAKSHANSQVGVFSCNHPHPILLHASASQNRPPRKGEVADLPQI
jgi:hypothetical protein